MVKFLNNISLEQANDIQFKTTAGANAGKISQTGDDLVISNAVGDILLGNGSDDIYIGDGTNTVDIRFEQNMAIFADSSSTRTLTLGGANTNLVLDSPSFSGSVTLPVTTINSKMTFGTAAGYILFDYEPTTSGGEYSSEVPLLRVDRSGTELTILSRVSNNGAVILGNDDGVAILAGDVKAVIKDNLNLGAEEVVIAAEGGWRSYSFPSNDTTWSNRNEFRFYGADATAANNGLYIGDGGSTQFIDLSRNLKNIGSISCGAISSGNIQASTVTATELTTSSQGDISTGTSYQQGTVSAAQPVMKSSLLAHSTESNESIIHPYIFNDLANFVNRSGTVTYGGLSGNPTSDETDRMFMASALTCNVSNSEITGSTWTIELKDFPRSLSYGTRIGISFGSPSFSPSSMVIEYSTDNGSSYTTALTSSVRNEYYHTFVSNGGTGVNAIKFTLGKYTGADPRVMNIYAYNYDSRGMTEYFVDKGGDTLYGNLSVGSNSLTAGSLDINGNADISGTLTSVTYQGDVIASAYLDADTMHLSGTQTSSGAKTFSNVGNHYNGHHYYDPYDTNGNHYPHFLDGSNNSGTIVQWRQYYGSNYKAHTWQSDASGNMVFTFQGAIKAVGELEGTSLDINGDADISGTLTSGAHTINSQADSILTLNQTGTDTGWSYIDFKTSGTRNWYIGQDNNKNFDIYNDNTDSLGLSINYINNTVSLGGNTIVSGELEATSLDINGNADISGSLTITGSILNNVENASLDIYGGNDTTNDAHIKLHGNANNYGSMELNYGYDATNSYFKVKQGSTENFVLQGGNATFAGNVALGGGALQSYHANVTSALALDDQISVFTRANQMFLGNNFYYGASDGGIAIEADKSSLIQIDRDKVRFFFAASVSAGASASLQEKFRLDDTGKLTISGEIEGGSLDINGNADISGNLAVDGIANLDNTDIDGTFNATGTTFDVNSSTSLTLDNTNTTNGVKINTATSGSPVTIGHTTSEVIIGDNLVVNGNLTTKGDTILESTTNTTIKDTVIQLNDGVAAESANTSDTGILINRGSLDKVFMGWDETADKFVLVTTSSAADAAAGTLSGLTTETNYQTLVANIIAPTMKIGFGNSVGDVHASSTSTSLGTSNTLVPTQNAVKSYVDGLASNYATSAQGTLATNALPKAGGNMTGAINILTDSTSEGAMLKIENDGTGDAVIDYVLTGTNMWRAGIDNSDSDKFKWGIGSLGSYERMSLSTGGNLDVAGDVNVGDDLNITGDQLTFTNDAASAYIRAADALFIESDFDNDDGGSKPIYFRTNGTEMARMEATVATFAGEVEAASLDINGNADISGDLTGLDNVTSTNFVIGGHTINDVDLGGEFVDSNNHLLTSAGAHDRFLRKTSHGQIGDTDVAFGTTTNWANNPEPGFYYTNYNGSSGLVFMTGDVGGSASSIGLEFNYQGSIKVHSNTDSNQWHTHSVWTENDFSKSSVLNSNVTSVSGNAGSVTNGVYTTGAQTIAGVKTFTGGLVLDDGSGAAPIIKWVNGSDEQFSVFNNTNNKLIFQQESTTRMNLSSGGLEIVDGLKVGTGATITTILDEDNMASNSATVLATQQSIKAYVDSSVSSAGGGDVTLSGTQTFTGVKTFSADIILQDNVEVEFGTGSDVKMKFDGSDFVTTVPSGSAFMIGTNGGTPHDNNGHADFVVDVNASPQISWYSGQIQVGGTNMNWEGKINTTSSIFNIGGWNRDMYIFTQGSGSDSAKNIYIRPQAAGGTTTTVATFNGDNGTTLTGAWSFGDISGGSFKSYTWGTELDISALNSGGWARAHRIITSDTSGQVFFGVLGNNTTTTRAYWTLGDPSSIDATGYNSSNGIVLLKDGKVGIGDSSPSYKLDVNGDARITSHLYSDSSMRAPIFYDSGNTSYYLDPANTGKSLNVAGEIEGASLDINGSADIAGSLHITQNAGTLNLVGTDHSYIQWYPDGLSAGRKAYTGYGGATDNSFSIVNEISGGNVKINTNGGAIELLDNTVVTGELEATSLDINGNADISGNLGVGITPVSKLHVYENSSGTGSGSGITVENDSTGDALVQYLLTATRRWVTGIDNSDSDKFKIASSADLGTDTEFALDTSGNATFTGDVTSGGKIEATHDTNHVAKFTNTATSMSNSTYTLMVDSSSHTSNMSAAGAFNVEVNSGNAFTIAGNGNATFAGAVTVGADDTGYDVIFYGDTSGEYLQWDASSDRLEFKDNVGATFGSDGDFNIVHNGSHTFLKQFANKTGNIYIQQATADQDIILQADDGSGGTAEYLRIDGGITSIVVSKDLLMAVDGDGGKLKFGASQDLQIYHQGANSFIDEAGTGNLYIRSATNMFFQTYGSGKKWITLTEDAGVDLFHNDSLKLATSSSGVSVTGAMTASADVVAFSDKKLKENIETLDGKKVLDMRGVSFTRKDTGEESSGVIAQEIQKVAPELVHDTEGTLGVAYGNLVGYLIEAVKDQQKQIDELKAIINGSSK